MDSARCCGHHPGFMEAMADLDNEAKEACGELGIPMARAATVGIPPCAGNLAFPALAEVNQSHGQATRGRFRTRRPAAACAAIPAGAPASSGPDQRPLRHCADQRITQILRSI